MRPLIEAINLHTDRLDKLIAARQRFIADASHQVRTPLAVLKTQVEYGLRQEQSAVTHAVLTDVRGTIDQTARLIDQLLVLARAEPQGMPEQAFAEVNLCELARSTALEWVPVARQKQIDLAFESAEEGGRVRGTRLLLHELIANLIDNAIRYTQVDGKVTAWQRRTSPAPRTAHSAGSSRGFPKWANGGNVLRLWSD